ncbi:MAG: cell filamentation protein Fic, partial [Thermodesulfobacteriota bacterium]|nr:cell filamentation protein Fic [Thermodesulfobacteriota bacterium]
MEKNIPEVVFGSSDKSISQSISRMVKSGKLRKLMPRVYTSNFNDPAEVIVGRNLYLILGKLFPGALLSHRTALEGRPTMDHTIFLTYKYTKKVELPGFTVRLIKGHDPTKHDMPFLDGLYISSEPRAYLENMQLARSRGYSPKSLPKEAIEERLNRICQIRGEEELNQLRAKAREIAGQLNLEAEFRSLNKIISALLQTSPAKVLKSPLARARAF